MAHWVDRSFADARFWRLTGRKALYSPVTSLTIRAFQMDAAMHSGLNRDAPRYAFDQM
jgi:hypothetical protein